MSHIQIAIIGAGPAGLSLARLLKERDINDVVVFEAADRVGGKSRTMHHGDTIVEMGTCYASRAHRVTNRWMKELGIETKSVGESRFGGAEFMDYVRAGDGPSLPFQLLTFLRKRSQLTKAMSRPNPSLGTLAEASMDCQSWLAKYRLGKINHFMRRSTTALGYGFLDETSIIQAMRWNDLDLILSGALNQLTMPVLGWSDFWTQVANDLDIRYSSQIKAIRRGSDMIDIDLGEETITANQLVCAIPLDDLLKITEANDAETRVCDGIEWSRYVTTLFAADNWFDTYAVEGWHEPLTPGAPLGQLLSARLEGEEASLGGKLYVGGQLPGSYTKAELGETLKLDVEKHGGELTNIIHQAEWKYFPRYLPEAIRNGLIEHMRDMQGTTRTWYTGATFSFEAVSNITNFNTKLAEQISASRTYS